MPVDFQKWTINCLLWLGQKPVQPIMSRRLIFITLAGVFAGLTVAAEENSESINFSSHAGHTVTITGDEIVVIYRGSCSGDFEGFLRREGKLLIAENYGLEYLCTISIFEEVGGALHLDQGPGCADFHGVGCTLSGTVYPVDQLSD